MLCEEQIDTLLCLGSKSVEEKSLLSRAYHINSCKTALRIDYIANGKSKHDKRQHSQNQGGDQGDPRGDAELHTTDHDGKAAEDEQYHQGRQQCSHHFGQEIDRGRQGFGSHQHIHALPSLIGNAHPKGIEHDTDDTIGANSGKRIDMPAYAILQTVPFAQLSQKAVEDERKLS